MPYEFKIVRRVEFIETDMAGIVHYSNFFRYMEFAETAFIRSLGFSIWTQETDPPVGWPRVHAECDFTSPLRFEDEVEIHLLVAGKSARSLSYAFRLRKLNAQPPIEVGRGLVTVVCVTQVNGKLAATPLPKSIGDQIEVAPKELLAA
ncbi:MAG: acyl-CoA thioesterase [Pedosphaera sp.]|nr:acyl-CoA thioesterase [Pedosphaera sp.]